MGHADDSGRLEDDYRFVADGIRPEQPRPYVFALTRILTDLMRRARRDHDVAPAMRFLHANIARSQEGLKAARVACSGGCWFCCSRWVDAKVPEVLHVARAIRDRPERIAALAAAHVATAEASFEARKTEVTPCPMLVDSRCSVYEERPLACRSAVSRDAATCERSYLRTNEPIPKPVVYGMVGRAYALALTVALSFAGLDHRAYEFNEALVRACGESEAEHRWLDGEDVFRGVKRSPGDLLDDPQTRAFMKEVDCG